MFSFFFFHAQNRNSSLYNIPPATMRSSRKINVSMLSLMTGIAIGTGELHYAREGCCEELPMEDIPPRIPVL